MARILIFEDSENDLARRYSQLATQHDVHVRYRPETGGRTVEAATAYLVRAGFNAEHIRPLTDLTDIDGFDLYLLDGLVGRCFEIIDTHLPREKAYIHTSSEHIMDQAQANGYQLLRSIEAALAQAHHTQ